MSNEQTTSYPRPGHKRTNTPYVGYTSPAPKKSRVNWLVLGAAILALLIATGGYLVAKQMMTGSSDSGVSACQTMADNTTKPAAEKTSVGMADFQGSKYSDLKVAGVDFVTTVKTQVKDDAGLGEALGTVTKLHTQYAILQTACANHGVNLPPLPA